VILRPKLKVVKMIGKKMNMPTEALHDVYSSPNIIGVIELRRQR